MKTIARAAIVAPPLWFAVVLVLGFVKPGYDPAGQAVSELSVGTQGSLMIVSFVALGAVELALAGVLWLRRRDRTSTALALLTGVAAVGTILAGVFVIDEGAVFVTLESKLHRAAVLIAFAALSAAALLVWHRSPRGSLVGRCSLLTGITVLPLFFIAEQSGAVLGIVQRLGIAIAMGWLTLVALGLLQRLQRNTAAEPITSSSVARPSRFRAPPA
jgi:hypothetical membrane protein